MSGFTEDEREHIREQLIETGRELLLQYGPKKTTVEDITEPTRIAKPTFYQFFDAKSDLYLVIFQREFDTYIERVRTEVEGVDDPQDRLERFFWCYVEFGEKNPFIQQMAIQGNYQEILRNVSPDRLAELQRREVSEFLPIIEDIKARSDGPIAEMEPLTVLGLMGTLGLLILHRDEYQEYEGEIDSGDDYYSHIQSTLVSTLARGLVVE